MDNRPGGNTIIGSEALVRAAPDGYTVLMVTSTHTVNPSVIKTPYDAVKDFAPVTTLTRSPFGLVVHPSLPVKSLREFIALAKSRPGQLDYASAQAAAWHLSSSMSWDELARKSTGRRLITGGEQRWFTSSQLQRAKELVQSAEKAARPATSAPADKAGSLSENVGSTTSASLPKADKSPKLGQFRTK